MYFTVKFEQNPSYHFKEISLQSQEKVQRNSQSADIVIVLYEHVSPHHCLVLDSK